MLAHPTAPGAPQDEPRLTIKMVSIAERGTAMVTAIEAGQSHTQAPPQPSFRSNEVVMATLQLVSFGYSSGSSPRNCVRTINCSQLEALFAAEGRDGAAPSIEALCSFLVCELQALAVSRSAASSPATPCLTPPLSPMMPAGGSPLPWSLSGSPSSSSSASGPRSPIATMSPLPPPHLAGPTPTERCDSGDAGPGAPSGSRGSDLGGDPPVIRVAIGCRDGTSMSVRVADHLATQLGKRGIVVTVRHRELRRAARRGAADAPSPGGDT